MNFNRMIMMQMMMQMMMITMMIGKPMPEEVQLSAAWMDTGHDWTAGEPVQSVQCAHCTTCATHGHWTAREPRVIARCNKLCNSCTVHTQPVQNPKVEHVLQPLSLQLLLSNIHSVQPVCVNCAICATTFTSATQLLSKKNV